MRSKRLRVILILILCAVFAVSGVTFAVRMADYRRGEELYTDARQRFVVQSPEAADTPEPPSDPDEAAQAAVPSVPPVTMDFDALAEINGDIIGWITIPDTNISYPLLQGESNDTYLRTAYNFQPSRMGSIFMDFRCSADLCDRHTIIYGHNMRNSTMFSQLLKYSSQSFYDAHPLFYIYTPEGRLTYKIFSAYMLTLPSEIYTIGFASDESFDPFVASLTSSTAVATNVFPTGGDKVVTLSTCSSTDAKNHRFVVHGYLIEDTRPGSPALAGDAE